ncbi:MAG TPA: hypothetical protein VF118_04765 [Gemmatimonadaceae bacterium]
MRVTGITRWAAVAAVVTAQALNAQGAPPAQPAASQAAAAAAPAQAPTVCGNTAYCTETNDFAAVITNFRTSDFRGYKMIDVVMHFVNKTPKSLVLGYVQNSGTIIDDKGNRYVVWGANGVRGMGQVYGGTFDPKFTLDGGGSGDAQFELAWYPGTQIYGFNFAFDLAIDEINSYEGGQHSLGGEFPLHFQGLANGISSSGQVAMGGGAAGGMGAGAGAAAGGQPCNNGGAAGTATAVANATGSEAVQGAAQQGASTVAQATTAVQSIASIFSKKKSQPNKPAAIPCGAAGGTVTQSAAGSVATPATGATAAPAGSASTATTAPATTAATPATTGTSANPVAMKAGGVRPGTKAPVTQPTTTTAPATTTTTTTPTTHNPAPKTGPKKTVTPDTTKHP